MEKEKVSVNQPAQDPQPVSGSLDQGLIERALQKSPSGNNAKPLNWSWNEKTLLLTHDVSKAQHYLNRGDHASLIALGCALTSIEVAAQVQGFQMQARLPNFLEATWTVRIDFAPTEQKTLQSLAKRMLQRATYRKAFQPSSVSPELQQELLKMSQGEAGLGLVLGNKISSDFKNYILKTETYLWAQTRAIKDFLQGVNFSKRIQTADERGISSADLGINRFDQLFLSLLNLMPSLISILVRLPGMKAVFASSANKNFTDSHFLVIHLKEVDSHHIVQAGQLAMKAWLKLEAHGYRAQPMSSGSLCLLDALKGHLPADTKTEFRALFSETGPRILAEQFQLSSQEHPVWILRFGKATNPNSRSLDYFDLMQWF